MLKSGPKSFSGWCESEEKSFVHNLRQDEIGWNTDPHLNALFTKTTAYAPPAD